MYIIAREAVHAVLGDIVPILTLFTFIKIPRWLTVYVNKFNLCFPLRHTNFQTVIVEEIVFEEAAVGGGNCIRIHVANH